LNFRCFPALGSQIPATGVQKLHQKQIFAKRRVEEPLLLKSAKKNPKTDFYHWECIGKEVEAPRGGREKKVDESDVHLPQPQNKIVTYFILFLCYCFFIDFFYSRFWAFCNKGG
jgi:hypothetical protein